MVLHSKGRESTAISAKNAFVVELIICCSHFTVKKFRPRFFNLVTLFSMNLIKKQKKTLQQCEFLPSPPLPTSSPIHLSMFVDLSAPTFQLLLIFLRNDFQKKKKNCKLFRGSQYVFHSFFSPLLFLSSPWPYFHSTYFSFSIRVCSKLKILIFYLRFDEKIYF